MKEKNGEHPWGDIGQIISLMIFLIVWTADSFFLRQSTFPAGYLPLYFRLTFLGLMLVAGACLFRASHYIAHRETRPGRVVDQGAFRRVRHPLYLASLLPYLGLTVSTASLASLLVFAGIFIFYNFIAGYEERLLEKEYPEQYQEYKRKTGRWIPRWRRD
ncbi:MAG: isoprenylcysteine carboxylmethyltransferase family protein [Candidatus Krumholzibacteriota bacterium]|nr:isoprenylcysteine carboxylmethyltransferase family protein [Candidatus Krumholzibacteriota bacterium]